MAVPDSDLSLFHMNIRSLSLHFDELYSLLSCLNVNFQVIGIGNIGRYGGTSGTFWKGVGREREEKLNYERYFVN